MRNAVIPNSISLLATLFVLSFGIIQAEAYDGEITITDLRLYDISIGKDSFLLEGIIGPDEQRPLEPIAVKILDDDENATVFEGYTNTDDSYHLVLDDVGKFWPFTINRNTLERWSADNQYTVTVQYDDKSDEKNLSFGSGVGNEIIIEDKNLDDYQIVQTKIVSDRSEDDDGTGYSEVGTVVSLNTRVQNPHDYQVDASIEYVFENVEGDNFWENKKHTGTASANGAYGTHQKYFMQNPGKFYIHMIYSLNGEITQDSGTHEFIVFEKYSDAALNGCFPDREIIGKPDYSLAVYVFPESVDKLIQRGWVGD